MKELIFTFFNKQDDCMEMEIRIPYHRIKARNGYYSGYWKDVIKPMQMAIASGRKIPKSFIRLGFGLSRSTEYNRQTMRTKSGAVLDMPFDLTEKEYRVLGLHLEGIKLALSDNG